MTVNTCVVHHFPISIIQSLETVSARRSVRCPALSARARPGGAPSRAHFKSLLSAPKSGVTSWSASRSLEQMRWGERNRRAHIASSQLQWQLPDVLTKSLFELFALLF